MADEKPRAETPPAVQNGDAKMEVDEKSAPAGKDEHRKGTPTPAPGDDDDAVEY